MNNLHEKNKISNEFKNSWCVDQAPSKNEGKRCHSKSKLSLLIGTTVSLSDNLNM